MGYGGFDVDGGAEIGGVAEVGVAFEFIGEFLNTVSSSVPLEVTRQHN
jgi:hypothetical protein